MTEKRLKEIKKLMFEWFQVLENNGAYHLGPNECTLAIRELLKECERSVKKVKQFCQLAAWEAVDGKGRATPKQDRMSS